MEVIQLHGDSCPDLSFRVHGDVDFGGITCACNQESEAALDMCDGRLDNSNLHMQPLGGLALIVGSIIHL